MALRRFSRLCQIKWISAHFTYIFQHNVSSQFCIPFTLSSSLLYGMLGKMTLGSRTISSSSWTGGFSAILRIFAKIVGEKYFFLQYFRENVCFRESNYVQGRSRFFFVIYFCELRIIFMEIFAEIKMFGRFSRNRMIGKFRQHRWHLIKNVIVLRFFLFWTFQFCKSKLLKEILTFVQYNFCTHILHPAHF